MTTRSEEPSHFDNPIQQLQRKMGELSHAFPQVELPGKNLFALFKTNEKLGTSFAEHMPSNQRERNLFSSPNGYIVGVGFGSILRTLSLFDELQPPKGIVAADTMSHVVLGGRIMVEVLRQSATHQDFFEHLGDQRFIADLMQTVINQERSEDLKGRFRDGNIQQAVAQELRESSISAYKYMRRRRSDSERETHWYIR